MFCTNCGANVPDDSKFCGGCGFSFDGDDAPQTQSPPPEYQQAPPINQPQSSGGNTATTILATVCVCVIVAAAVGGAYFLGARSSDDSSSNDQTEVVTQAPSDSTSETTSSSDTTTAESTAPTESTTTDTTSSGETTTVIPEAPTYEAPAEPVNHDYIIPDSNTRYLTHQELHTSGLTQEELALARNEIYARHGRRFSNPSYQAWFDSKTWYQNIYPKYSSSTFDSLNPTPLSAIEIDNIETIKQVESVYGNVPG